MRVALTVIGCLAASGCAQQAPTAPSICEGDPTCVDSPQFPYNVGTLDAGSPPSDAAVTDVAIAVVRVSGTLLVVTQLPIEPTGALSPRPSMDWQISTTDAPNAIAAATDENGLFTLANVPVVNGAYHLRAVPPARYSGLATTMSFAPTTGNESPIMYGLPLGTIQAAASNSGVTIESRAGHVVLQLSGTVRSGASLQLFSSTGQVLRVPVLYDSDSLGFSNVTEQTESHGMALALDIPLTGDGDTITCHVSGRGTNTQTSVHVGVGEVAWISL